MALALLVALALAAAGGAVVSAVGAANAPVKGPTPVAPPRPTTAAASVVDPLPTRATIPTPAPQIARTPPSQAQRDLYFAGPLLGRVTDYRPDTSITIDPGAQGTPPTTFALEKDTQVVPLGNASRRTVAQVAVGGRVQVISRPGRDGKTLVARIIQVEDPNTRDPNLVPPAPGTADPDGSPTPPIPSATPATDTPTVPPSRTPATPVAPAPAPTAPATAVPPATPTAPIGPSTSPGASPLVAPLPSPTPSLPASPRATRTPLSGP